MPTSQNGWSANDISATTTWTVPGTTRTVRLRKGDAGWLLVHFAAWFDKHIEEIEDGVFDDWGYAERPIRGSSTTLSNHASGTALDLNATRHPLGKRGTFTADQAAKIRAQLGVYDGAIRWGGDYHNRADEMHFEINTNPTRVTAVAARIRHTEEDDMPYTEAQLLKIVEQAIDAKIPAIVAEIKKSDLFDDPKVKQTIADALKGKPARAEK